MVTSTMAVTTTDSPNPAIPMKNSLPLLLLSLLMSHTASAQDVLTLADGSSLGYYLATPRNSSEEAWPLAIFMGGGAGDQGIAYTAFRYYAVELARQGWAVAVPISPNNRSFRGENMAKVRELIAALQARDDIVDGKLLIGGISAGGMSALEFARRNPEDFFGVLAVPAVLDNPSGYDTLRGMPVYLRIGSEDELGWADRFNATVRALESVGAVVDAEIVYGGPHMFGIDFDLVKPWLDGIRAEAH